MLKSRIESGMATPEEVTQEFDEEKAKKIMNMSINDFMTDPSINSIESVYCNLQGFDDKVWGAYNLLEDSGDNPEQLGRLKKLINRMGGYSV